jgi:NAD+ kinase
MQRIFNKIWIVPKLNQTDSALVARVVKIITSAAICSEPLIPVLKDYSEIDHDTLVIAVGGDGTMLEAMRIAALKGAIATGINLGNVGFLTDIAFDRGMYKDQVLFDELIVMFHKSGLYPLEHRMSLDIVPSKAHDCAAKPVFNEFVFSNAVSDTLIKYHLEINHYDAGYHKANGIIVGTPTGSTAYTLSNGGGLILPSMNVMQVVPIAPLSMSSRPIIVPGDAVVRITVETEGKWTIKGDGNRLYEFNSTGPSIEITQFHKNTRILHTKEWNFFEMLTSKLHWKHL